MNHQSPAVRGAPVKNHAGIAGYMPTLVRYCSHFKKGKYMDIYVDTDLCSGCALCSDICPEVFEVGEYGYVEINHSEINVDNKELCMQAIQSCPENAMSL